MHDIICPHCSKAFKVDEAGYADILKQVRDREFEQQLSKRLALAEQEKRNAIDLAMARKQTELQELEAQLRARDVKQELARRPGVQCNTWLVNHTDIEGHLHHQHTKSA
jgi:hypothetical protein